MLKMAAVMTMRMMRVANSRRFIDKVRGSGILMSLDPSPNNTGVVIFDYRRQGMHAQDPIHVSTIRQYEEDVPLDFKAAKAMAKIYRMIREFSVERIVCEQVASVGFGRRSNYNSNSSMTKMEGQIQLIAEITGITLRMYAPRTWKAAYKIKGDDQKQQARNLATQFSGLHYLTFDEHSAEAYLIGLYDIRNFAVVEAEQVRFL